MGDPALEPDDHFTYRQYKTWPDEERWELIDGHAWSMSPAPRTRHQTLLGKLHLEFGTFLRGKPCKVFLAPFDVLIPKAEEPDDDVDTVVQPDLVVFCDRSRITDKGSRGAPDRLRNPRRPIDRPGGSFHGHRLRNRPLKSSPSSG
jgi:hypothetical protein